MLRPYLNTEPHMITFLPLPDFTASAKSLENLRLGNQRAEALWMCRNVIRGNTHPVVYMWHGWLKALVEYGKAICLEWQCRGKLDAMYEEFMLLDPGGELVYPPWLGSHLLHSSHRANLVRKDPGHYRKQGWTESLEFIYFWPTPIYDWRTNAKDRLDSYHRTGNEISAPRPSPTDPGEAGYTPKHLTYRSVR
jgi:Pyrimidine dimer DNA glycosylase